MVFLGNKILFLYNDAGGNMPKVTSAEKLVEFYKEGKRDFANSSLIGADLKGVILEGANLDARDRLGDTPLMNAALKGHIEIAEFLISKGADVSLTDNWGNTALIDSAKYAKDSTCDIIALLVDHDADVNAKNKLGLTALIFAAQGGHVENIGCLISEGADVNAKSKSGETALKLAETSERKDIIDLLKENGAME